MATASESRDVLDEQRLEVEPGPLATGGKRLEGDQLYTWYRELREWVAHLRVDYPFLWPEFPRCWYRHRGLVELFALLRSAQQALVKHGAPNVPQRDALDWTIFLQTVATAVYRVSRQCRGGHVDHQRLYHQVHAQSDAALDQWLHAQIPARDAGAVPYYHSDDWSLRP